MRFLTLFVAGIIFFFTNPINGFCENFTDKTATKLLHASFKSSLKPVERIYKLKKGWNKLKAPKDGIDIAKTFAGNAEVTLVAFYAKQLQQWALFFHKDETVEGMANYLFLESLEPDKVFFVKSTKDSSVKIVKKKLSAICKKYLKNKNYLSLVSSGVDKNPAFSKVNQIGVAPRYRSDFHRGYYNDSRILLIYPKLKQIEGKLQSYGPAEPYIKLRYDRNYESKEFFIFDYMNADCYKGIFPSQKIPPYPLLYKFSDKEDSLSE